MVNFSTLHLILHQEGIENLLSLSDLLIRKITEMQGDKSPVESDRMADADQKTLLEKTLAVIHEEDDDEDPLEKASAAPTQSKKQKRKGASVVESIKIHFIANLEQFAVLLTCHKRPLASLKVQHFDAGVILKSSYTELNLQLRNILITDLNKETIHTKASRNNNNCLL